MKKALLILLGLITAESAVAQTNQKTLGVQAGSILYFPEEVWWKQDPFTAGIFYEQAVFKRFGLQTGLYYASGHSDNDLRGMVYDTFVPGPHPDLVHYKSHYLDLPLNLTFRLGNTEAKKFETYLLVGYMQRFLLSSKQTLTYSDHQTSEYVSLKQTDKTTDYLNFGFETRIALSPSYKVGFGAISSLDPVSYDLRNSSMFNLYLKFGRNL